MASSVNVDICGGVKFHKSPVDRCVSMRIWFGQSWVYHFNTRCVVLNRQIWVYVCDIIYFGEYSCSSVNSSISETIKQGKN